MEYQVLTDDQKRAMWQRAVAQLEEQHYALMMDRQLAASIRPKAGEAVHPTVAAHLKEVDVQIAGIEQQHAEAVASLAECTPVEETLHVVRDAREAVGD